MNIELKLMYEGAKSKVAKTALGQIRELDRLIRKFKAEHQPEIRISEFKQECLELIRAEVKANTLCEIDRIKKRFSDKEKAYYDSYEEHDFKIKTLRLRYEAMSDSELQSECLSIAGKPNGIDPNVANLMMIELKNRNPESYNEARSLFLANDYQRPYLADDEGNALKAEMAALEKAIPQSGQGVVMLEGTRGDGSITYYGCSVNEVFDLMQGEVEDEA